MERIVIKRRAVDERAQRGRGGGGGQHLLRRTLVALVSLPSLMIALLMPCSVVVYLLSELLTCSKESAPLAGWKMLAVPMYGSQSFMGQQSCTIVFLRKSLPDWRPLKMALYLTNICSVGVG